MHQKCFSGARLGDGLAILLVLLLFTLSLGINIVHAVSPASAVLIVTDNDSLSYPLSSDREIKITSGGHVLTVAVRNGFVCVSETDCPSGVCAATGEISQTGQSIVCLPAHVLIKIVGEVDGSENADFILP